MPLNASPLPEQTARARFEELWRAHYPDVFGYTLRRLGDEAAAGDVTAEVFTVAWRRFDFAPEPSRAWLLAIARKLLANNRRARLRRQALVARVRDQRPAGSADEPEPDGLLAAAFNALSPRDREVLSLVTWQELATAEAAEVLEITPAQFSVRLHRAKARLRRKLERSGHHLALAAPSRLGAADSAAIGLEAE